MRFVLPRRSTAWRAGLLFAAGGIAACDQSVPRAGITEPQLTPAPRLAVAAAGANGYYTTDADFDLGSLLSVNHDAPNNNQLQLDNPSEPFPFINIAASARGTMVRIDVNTGAILGEYFTAPNGRGRDPSRTTVDQFGSVWVANRAEFDGGKGSVTRVGLVVGGTRVNADRSPNPGGEYLAPPYKYNTCTDRNGDNLLRTSRGLGDIRPWSNAGGVDNNGGVASAEDECVINYTRVTGTGTRTLAIDRNNDIWVGGIGDRDHEKLSGVTGQPVPGTQINFGCGGYGGLIDRRGVLWSARNLLRYDPATGTGTCLGNTRGDYGLGLDPRTGNVWQSSLFSTGVHGPCCRLYELDAAGNVLNSYPQPFGAQGVAVDGRGHVWVAEIFGSRIAHYAPDPANPGKHIFVGNVTGLLGVTGVAVDANGKLWGAEINSSASHGAARIDPNAGPLGAGGYPIGAIDKRVGLGAGAGPYNYSDMTGFVAVGGTSPQGTWSVVRDGGVAGANWGRVSWNSEAQGRVPAGSSIVVEARVADTQTGLASATFFAVSNGGAFDRNGRFIEVRATLRAAPDGSSPVLSDIRIEEGTIEVAVNIKPGSNPNSMNLRGDAPLAVLTTRAGEYGLREAFDATQIDWTTVRFGPLDVVQAGGGGIEIHGRVHLEDSKEMDDASSDGDTDAVMHFDVRPSGITAATTRACVVGKTRAGRRFRGCDAVRVAGQ